MRILVYHPTGNENVRALLHALEYNNMLESFHTTVAVFNNSWYYPLLKDKLSQFKRRTYDNKIKNKTHKYPVEELMMFIGVRHLCGHKLNPDYIDYLITKKVVKYIRKHHAKIDAIFCYPGHSSLVMETAHKYKIKCIIELTTAYYKNIYKINKKEKEYNKNWYEALTLATSVGDWNKEMDKEIKLADFIICPSNYIKATTTEYYPSKKIEIIPYGCPKTNKKDYIISKPIKILYVGNLSQSKGLSYLFNAVDKLKGKFKLTIIGDGILNSDKYKHILKKYNYIGKLPHNKILEMMHNSDIFIFPTLSDGFGMVITEAMSQGTPVITTYNSAGKDIIKNGINGWLIPIQNANSIYLLLKKILEQPNLIRDTGEKAIKFASEHPWQNYETQIVDFIKNNLINF